MKRKLKQILFEWVSQLEVHACMNLSKAAIIFIFWTEDWDDNLVMLQFDAEEEYSWVLADNN